MSVSFTVGGRQVTEVHGSDNTRSLSQQSPVVGRAKCGELGGNPGAGAAASPCRIVCNNLQRVLNVTSYIMMRERNF